MTGRSFGILAYKRRTPLLLDTEEQLARLRQRIAGIDRKYSGPPRRAEPAERLNRSRQRHAASSKSGPRARWLRTSTANTSRWSGCFRRTNAMGWRISAPCRDAARLSGCCKRQRHPLGSARSLGFSRYRDDRAGRRIRNLRLSGRRRTHHGRRLPRPPVLHAGLRGGAQLPRRAGGTSERIRRPHHVQRQELRSAAA